MCSKIRRNKNRNQKKKKIDRKFFTVSRTYPRLKIGRKIKKKNPRAMFFRSVESPFRQFKKPVDARNTARIHYNTDTSRLLDRVQRKERNGQGDEVTSRGRGRTHVNFSIVAADTNGW